jgi:opacity protein-like surface antigen
MERTLLRILLLAFGASCASTRVLADDSLGFYVGAAIGEAHVRANQEIIGDTGYDYRFDEQHSAWKVIAGVRPISPLGVELEYIDFGNPGSANTFAGLGGLSQADAKALALFGVGYLPLPVPVGATFCGPTTFNISDSSTDFAYGAGVQGKFGPPAIRAEYERISASSGNPDLLSLGVTWTF